MNKKYLKKHAAKPVGQPAASVAPSQCVAPVPYPVETRKGGVFPLPDAGFVDLHSHTTASDGLNTPRELVELAFKAGLCAIAVTDHDTIAGTQEALCAGKEYGIIVIPGCEISSMTPYGEMHIVGLWTPPDSMVLKAELQSFRSRRNERNQAILERFNTLNMPLSMEEIEAFANGDSIGRPHIAAALIARGYVRSKEEAFEKFLAKGKAAYVPRMLPTPEEAVKLLHSVGAVTVLAHPMLLGAPLSWIEQQAASLKEYGLHAVEAYHSEHSMSDIRNCVDMASRLGLALSGGSDFHGDAHSGRQLGRGKGGLRIPVSVLHTLYALRAGN